MTKKLTYECSHCGDVVPNPKQLFHEGSRCCEECYRELTEGKMPPPDEDHRGGRGPDILRGDREYHGDQFQAGEW